MFFPFEDYVRVNVPQTNSNNAIVYTTTFDCMVFFMPRGSNMETDRPCGLFVDDFYNDTDGDECQPWLFYASDSSTFGGDTGLGGSRVNFSNYLNIPMMIPAGKNIRAFIGDSSDRLGGTLHVYKLPFPVLV